MGIYLYAARKLPRFCEHGYRREIFSRPRCLTCTDVLPAQEQRINPRIIPYEVSEQGEVEDQPEIIVMDEGQVETRNEAQAEGIAGNGQS